ncbi:immunoglobulin lambda-1 light chain-like [Narcine bancroftii]|uniref:immunoglobulin lambda-1 light chain-like n=1 Tax=Narcine bancroftii TaxID=1343680 RepID=UPI00383137E6
MAEWIRVLAALAILFQVTNSERILTQPTSISTSPGNTVKITCTLSGDKLSSLYTSWYQQKPGSAPVFVWYESSTRGPGIPDRFTGTVEESENKMHLTIANVQREDAADYYCGATRSSSDAFTFGRGTKLNLGTQQPPAVSVFRSSAEEIETKNTATLVCLVTGFNPGAVGIKWTVDGKTRKIGVETSRVQQETDNTFSASSYLTLAASDWNSHELYSCVVKHEARAIPFEASLTKPSCI